MANLYTTSIVRVHLPLRYNQKGKKTEQALHQESFNLKPLLGGSWSNYFEDLLYAYCV